jgi:putative transposase
LDWRIALVLGGLPKVDGRCEAELENLVEQVPRAIGRPFSVWTCLDLVKELTELKLADVCAETVRRHLRKLDYRVIRPVLSINSPDPDYAAKAEHLKQCQEQARQGEMILLYEDEVDLNLLPGIIRCWTKRGKQRKIPTPGQNQKRYGFGAVNFITGQLTYRVGERKNSDGFCALVEQVVAEYCPVGDYHGPKIGLVVDNYIIHRSKKTLACLEKYADRLEIIPLPTYAPKLNVIELLWKYLRKKVTHNHLYETIAQLVEAVKDFLMSLNERRAEVLSVIGRSG